MTTPQAQRIHNQLPEVLVFVADSMEQNPMLHDTTLNNCRPGFQPALIRDGLALYRLGSGVPVLFMPGPHRFQIPGDGSAQELIEGLVAIGKQVISFDPPESGYSTRPARLSLEEMHACANGVLDTLGITTPVDALGHSMGGLTLLAYAIKYPTRVRRLILVGTGANRWAYMQAPGALAHPRHPGFLGMALRALLHIALPCRASETLMNNYIDRWSFVDQQYVVRQAVRVRDWLQPRTGRADWHQIASRLDFTAHLHELSAPTLVMCGRHDTQFPLAASQVLASGIPNAQLTIFEHSNHFPFIEEREMFWKKVSDFLQVV